MIGRPRALLDRRVQFRRATLVTTGFGSDWKWNEVAPDADNIGLLVWAQKTPISDGERWRAGEAAAHVTTRFVVRWSLFSSGITPKDRLVESGQVYDIHGIKELAGTRRQWLEITASARTDQ
ncbi:head-tail adaptor protein [Pararhodobacter zhoushanensis]|uniref:Head-tail adaptor protein n=1 Tax=Pararhodobacter zhoushanensis TaxID=2479545 RepID=A0ABT3GYL5_9RHOB|nr:head-tail adaptor protein [Pararhodobacter zhoushanensis]MCW1932616.1 head-tail adaptor protein [Pararhodobacter zhoushanensis]